jgi:primosomal protein N' (replication factor Y) (superfamily II helicase)
MRAPRSPASWSATPGSAASLKHHPIVRVALDLPLDEAFDFRAGDADVPLGSLVAVPFGKTSKVGVVVGRAARSELPESRLRDIERVIPDIPPLAAPELALFRFCSRYYHRGLGEVAAAGLPPRLRQVNRRAIPAPVAKASGDGGFRALHALTDDQRNALELTLGGFDRFHPLLLQGVTGSGKTEVYFHLIAQALRRGRQALLMVPEIGLTPQLEAQVRDRFPEAEVFAAHSHLNEGERARSWLAAQSGAAHITLGTRLSILMPFARLGLVIADEENDASYKQQEGVRYSARDVAVRRAQDLGIPIVLGSATPSLETYDNALRGRYAHAVLSTRAAAGSTMPHVRTVDTRADRPVDGLTHALLEALKKRLASREQSLVFINRRGFAPVLHCRACGWHSTCTRCSANLVVHLRSGDLRCHHCGHRERVPSRCPDCGSDDIAPIGQGTQRVEEALQAALPGAVIARVDRDAATKRGALEETFRRVRAGEVDILVGTQMLAKGHDYPRLTLVGVLEADTSLFSADFRSAERLFTLLSQVAGRAGRGERPGDVLIQTDFPSHPLYAAVARHDYARFAGEALDERRIAGFPPFAFLALLRAESKNAGEAASFLRTAARMGRRLPQKVEIFDPVAPVLERKAGFERSQLLVRARSRGALQSFLSEWKAALLASPNRRVRWSLDVDPQEV